MVLLVHTLSMLQNNWIVACVNNNANHGIEVNDYIKFIQSDAQEAYKVTAVNGTSGQLTLNRGYRGSTATGVSVWKGVINEIPVGYVAFDVQKVQQNAARNNTAWAFNQTVAAGATCTNSGQAYYTVAGGTTAGAGSGPVHTSGSQTESGTGNVTWAHIGAVDTRLYLYGYTSQATKPPYKLQGFNIGARIQDKILVSLIDLSLIHI